MGRMVFEHASIRSTYLPTQIGKFASASGHKPHTAPFLPRRRSMERT
jgi:hypothetical protein